MTVAVKKLVGLRITMGPADPCWELPAFSSEAGLVALIGWVLQERPIDAGVPVEVARILGRVLTRFHKVTFCDPDIPADARSSQWSPVLQGWACALKPRGFFQSAIPLLCTADPEVAFRLFYTAHFRWELKSQAGILSPLADAPPALSYEAVRDLLDRDPKSAASVARCGGEGLLMPGVDGDFAALVLFDPGKWQRLRDAFERDCAAAGLSVSVAPEPEFKATAWFVLNEVRA